MALNNLQRLICHKTKLTNHSTLGQPYTESNIFVKFTRQDVVDSFCLPRQDVFLEMGSLDSEMNLKLLRPYKISTEVSPSKLSLVSMKHPFYPYSPNPSARAGYDTRSIFKRRLTGFNSEFSFS